MQALQPGFLQKKYNYLPPNDLQRENKPNISQCYCFSLIITRGLLNPCLPSTDQVFLRDVISADSLRRFLKCSFNTLIIPTGAPDSTIVKIEQYHDQTLTSYEFSKSYPLVVLQLLTSSLALHAAVSATL